MSREKLIFLTNDDSYRSKGFAAAIEVARQFGRVIAIAPDTPQSGMSQAITIYNPLYLRKVREEEGVLVYSLNGTPVDCVKMAFDHLFKDEKVDLVISGINHGSNAAVNVLYSGTMGAASDVVRSAPKRKAGGLTGDFYMAPDFDEPLECFKEYV